VDVAIVGGGPAGLYAGQLLAERGLRTRVREEHERIGEPVHCTGIVGAELFDLPGVPGDAVVARPSAARFHSPAGLQLDYAGPADEVCVVDRGAFDRGLAAAAGRAGAEIATGSRVLRLAIGPDRVTVHWVEAARAHSVRARVCVLACGASYGFQRQLGWGIPALHLAAAQTELEAATDDTLDVFLRADLAPRGFGWLVPIRRAGESRAKVGVMAARGARSLLARLEEDLRKAGRVSGAPGLVAARPLPLGPLARTYGDRVMAIGDAAGLVKPTTGGGIYYRLLSARWAVETLAEAFGRGDFTERVLGGYQETWQARLGLELSVGLWFRRLTTRLTPADLDALTELALTDGVIPVVRRTARFNWHRELIVGTLRHPGVLRIVLRRLVAARISA
ncbi:MAG TPA: NAD(P)/FAD-dependent oxidoreductase, partial [Methylomirabilota bacterium]|nr:NAD(P)/FAD-dependent oxidoreductase [Methylomirabilota bacterium]